MGLDPTDFDLVREIKYLQKETLEELRASRRANERIAEQQEKLLAVFNKVAAGLDTLASEIRELREEITPKMDKPRLPLPGGKNG